MDAQLLRQLNAERRARRAAILVTDLGDGRDRLIREGDRSRRRSRRDASPRPSPSGKSGSVEVEGRTLFLNVHVPPPRLVMIGAVHISQALAPMARLAGFDVCHHRSAHGFCDARPLPGHAASRRLAGDRAEGPAFRQLHGGRGPDARSEDRRLRSEGGARRRAASMSARSAAARPMPRASSALPLKARARPISRASTRPSASTSAHPAPPRSPSPCWRRSSPRCAGAAPSSGTAA